MCGRFTRDFSWADLHELMRVFLPDGVTLSPFAGGIGSSFNVAPTQRSMLLCAGDAGGEIACVLARWGLVPAWAKDSSIGSRMINARGETIAEKPAYRGAFARRRGIVPMSGFYEWERSGIEGGRKRPWYLTRADSRPLLAAGVWEAAHESMVDGALPTFSIVTTSANGFMSRMHDRMPVILEARDAWTWVGGPVEAAQSLIRPAPEGVLVGHGVRSLVNNPRNDSRELIACVPERGGEPEKGGKDEGVDGARSGFLF
ncbi:MAG: SOS response-associated peptidase [Phycisphaerales bacterium]|nr:MAG: SOS response-associated peptidase [Phycisphaerales bacterium]